jgi:AraC-like DNA-binding protein
VKALHTNAVELHKTPIRILGGGGHAAARGCDMPPHRHDCWELVCYRSGRPQLVVEGVARDASAGLVWLTPPGRMHAERALTAYANWYVVIAAPADQPWPLLGRDDAAGSIERLCSAIATELRRDGADRAEMLACLAAELDLRLRRLGQDGVRRPLVAEAESLLEQHDGALSIAALSRRLGVAPSTLRAAFHAARGASPAAAWRSRRIQRAVDLLAHTDLALEAVAGQCGFHSASHLTRWIRRQHGCTPGSLRRTDVPAVPP